MKKFATKSTIKTKPIRLSQSLLKIDRSGLGSGVMKLNFIVLSLLA